MHRYLKTHISWLFRHIFKYNNWNVTLQLFNKHINRKQSWPSMNINHFLAYIYLFPTPSEFLNNTSFGLFVPWTCVLNNQYQLTWFQLLCRWKKIRNWDLLFINNLKKTRTKLNLFYIMFPISDIFIEMHRDALLGTCILSCFNLWFNSSL